MTSHRASKRAARQRSAQTGRSYTASRREIIYTATHIEREPDPVARALSQQLVGSGGLLIKDSTIVGAWTQSGGHLICLHENTPHTRATDPSGLFAALGEELYDSPDAYVGYAITEHGERRTLFTLPIPTNDDDFEGWFEHVDVILDSTRDHLDDDIRAIIITSSDQADSYAAVAFRCDNGSWIASNCSSGDNVGPANKITVAVHQEPTVETLDTIITDTSRMPHVLISGPAGSGKTVTARSYVYDAIKVGDDVAIIDTVGAVNYAFAVDYALGVAGDLEHAAELMDEVLRRSADTYRLMMQHNVTARDDLPADIRPARLVIVVDSYSDLMRSPGDDPETLENQKQILSALTKIAREHRALGTSLVFVSQDMTAAALTNLPGHEVANRASRLVLGQANRSQLVATLRHPEEALNAPYSEPTRGHGWFDDGSSTRKVTIPYRDQEAYRVELEQLDSRKDAV